MPPGTPTKVVITPGSGSATIRFSPPSNEGGAPIYGYTATCTASGQSTRSASGSTSPLTVKNLSGGVLYRCTLIATNSAGLSS
ncbi:fibronectin type III domain-containing protein, partial [bacterium]|nr:fibronectin type III domain-containing protein [bacterium]